MAAAEQRTENQADFLLLAVDDAGNIGIDGIRKLLDRLCIHTSISLSVVFRELHPFSAILLAVI